MATKKQLEEAVELIKIPYKWMLKDIKMRADSTGNPGNYTDDLKFAIEVQKLLEVL